VLGTVVRSEWSAKELLLFLLSGALKDKVKYVSN